MYCVYVAYVLVFGLLDILVLVMLSFTAPKVLGIKWVNSKVPITL